MVKTWAEKHKLGDVDEKIDMCVLCFDWCLANMPKHTPREVVVIATEDTTKGKEIRDGIKAPTS